MRYYTQLHQNNKVDQCPIYSWTHRIPITKQPDLDLHCLACSRFIQIIPTHPYNTIECTDEPNQTGGDKK